MADLLGEPLPDIPIPEGEEALGTLLDALGRGEAEALFTLGMLCLRGEAGGILSRIDRGKLSGREQKGPVARGFEFLADAADAGHVGASYWAGALLQERNGLEVWGSVREARRYLKQAAGKRYGRAEERLGMPFAPPLLRPPFRKGVHGFDPLAFRRLRRPWLWAGLAPSLLLDGLFLAIAVHDRHVGETWATVGTLTVLAMILNALLFKAWPLHAYRRLQRLREGGEVRVGKEVSFLVLDWRQPEAGEGAVRYTLWRVLSVSGVARRRNGTLAVRGLIEGTPFLKKGDEKRGSVRGPVRLTRRLVLPACYRDMEEVASVLRGMGGAAQTETVR